MGLTVSPEDIFKKQSQDLHHITSFVFLYWPCKRVKKSFETQIAPSTFLGFFRLNFEKPEAL